MAHERAKASAAALAVPALGGICLAVIAGAGLLLTPTAWPFALDPLPLVGGVALLSVASIAVLCATFRCRLYGHAPLRRQTLSADHFAVELTGGPLAPALAATLHTLTPVGRGPISPFFAPGRALVHDRIE